MKRFLDVFLSLVLFGALTACGGRTSTPLNATATSLPTRHPPTQTFTPVPAVTLRPSPTTNQISATSTEITPISTLPICDPCANTTADPTQILLTTQISTLNKFCGGAGEGIFFINPRWEICSNTQNGFIVFSLEGTVWNFSFSDVPGLPKEADYTYHVIRWTADENYLYLSPNEGGGGGPWVFGYSPMLLRLELKTGKLSTILPFTGRSYDISISPSDRSMAYVLEEQQPLKIIIQDFATGLNNSITLDEKYVEAGEFFWSPDETKLTFKMAMDDNGQDNATYSIALIDLSNPANITMKRFIKDKSMRSDNMSDIFYTVEVTNNSVILQQGAPRYFYPQDGITIWVYDIQTQNLILQGTSTPFP